MGGTRGDSSQGIGHTTSSVIVEVHADGTVHSGHHVPHHGFDPAGKRTTVGVAQHQAVGARFSRAGQDPQRKIRVVGVAVEEVLGVEEHSPSVRLQKPDRVSHHGHALIPASPKGLGDVVRRALTHDAHNVGTGVEQVAQRDVVLDVPAHPASRPEGHQLRVLKVQFGCRPLEELHVLGVSARPPALDVVHAETVQLFSNAQLVVNGQRNAFKLRSITQRGVVYLHRLRQRARLSRRHTRSTLRIRGAPHERTGSRCPECDW